VDDMKKTYGILLAVLLTTGSLIAQDYLNPNPPMIKGYKDHPGKVFKNHYFNYITVKDETGENERQSTGHYWEVTYSFDSVFRQKRRIQDFMTQQLNDLGAKLFFQDTSSIHFAIPRETGGNLWGKVLLTSDKVYRLKLIEERVFVNKLEFDVEAECKYDEYVESVELPPRINFIPGSVIARSRYSKFNHFNINYVSKDKISYQQTLMGPYWDLKINVINEQGQVDKRISTVEVLESYYRSTLKAKGTIIKSRSRELIFNLPADDEKTLWVRVMASLDGTYFLRMVLQDNADATLPKSLIERKADSKKTKG
jgi:hypothetical protein